MNRNTTLKDIAKLLGTTPATVSRALNNRDDVSEKMKRVVLAAARELGYNKNKVASSLRLGRTGTIGVIIPSAGHRFFGSVIHGIVNVAETHGYDVLIHQSNESQVLEEKGVHSLIAARVDGILASIASGTVDFSHFSMAKKMKLPLVFFDRVNPGLGVSSVSVDDYSGAYQATEHLIKQGYRRIAHISGPKHVRICSERIRGYMNALKAYKINPDDSLIYPGTISIESGKAGIDFFMKLKSPPDAVFAVDDFTALGAMKELKDRHVTISEKFGVIGFCNELFGQYVTPTLSTFDQQTVLMGELAFKMIYDIIVKKKSHKACPVKNIVLEAIPIIRKSSLKKK
jgi:LacI family transcriptional regulator, galactose operon repressor